MKLPHRFRSAHGSFVPNPPFRLNKTETPPKKKQQSASITVKSKKSVFTTCAMVIAIMLSGLCSCSSTSIHSRADIPDFYLNPPNVPGVIFGFGTGDSLGAAMQNGRDDIARQLQVTIESRIAIHESSESNTSVEMTSVQEVKNLVLKNSKRIHMTVPDSGYYYVLLYYSENTPASIGETEILEKIRKREKTSLAVSTALSSTIPGTGQLMNRRYVKGSLMLAGAAVLIGTFSFTLSHAIDDMRRAQTATSNIVRQHYTTSSENYSTIALISAILYAGGALWSGLDNYSSQNR